MCLMTFHLLRSSHYYESSSPQQLPVLYLIYPTWSPTVYTSVTTEQPFPPQADHSLSQTERQRDREAGGMSDEVDCQRTLRLPVTPYPVWVLAWVCYTVSVCIYTVFVYICVCTSVCACLYVLVHSCAFMSVCGVLGYKSMCVQRV